MTKPSQSATYYVQTSAALTEIEDWGIALISSNVVGEGASQCMRFRTVWANTPVFDYTIAGSMPLGYYQDHELYLRLPNSHLTAMLVARYGREFGKEHTWLPAPAGKQVITVAPDVLQEAYRRARALGYDALLVT
ncbi:hypothetical protein ACLKMY_24820 [Paraburkholderia mimosarum]|uniref:hypothetical protein n=1 Tax=Paraburkholderia mimosarum TaxID=312026 RepID=UPI0039C36B7F